MGSSGPRGVFAERFALLYAEAGDPPLKKVTESVARARRTDEHGRPLRVPAQRVSDWRRGRNVPARFSALAAVLEVLVGEARKARTEPAATGLYDVDAWRALWEEALASPVTESADDAPEPDPHDTGVCPYRGLAAFRPEDSGWFFGRERSTAALVARAREAAATGGTVVLVGASGAGKSSLVRAGLLPAVGAEGLDAASPWTVELMTPGGDPLKELLHRLPELTDVVDETDDDRFARRVRAAFARQAEAEAGPGARTVLVVDQFEEAFTLGRDEERLRTFLHALHVASRGGGAPAVVVLGVRADFYARCLAYPELAEALQDRQMVLGPMTAAELREAVNRPARAAGLQLEPGLVDLVLRDLGVRGTRSAKAGDAYDSGALPLLSHALLATWQRRQAGKLTISGYRAAGGIQGAVAATAERAWADLDQAGQAAARPLLLRLVRVGDDTRDTRRRSTRQELISSAVNTAATEEALEVLARARLVTLDADSVEITHEALLQAWPRLRSWIDQDREGNLQRQRLEEDATTWTAQDRDQSLLYRGARLENARQWAVGAAPGALSAPAAEFLRTSERHSRLSTWGRRAAVAMVVVFALIAATAAVLAVNQRDEAVYRQVVAEADRVLDSDPSLSAQLALVAHRMRPDDRDVWSRLLSSQHTPLATPLNGHTGAVYLTSFRPDGRVLATASYDSTVRLWDVSDRGAPRPIGEPLRGHRSWVSSAVFSPDGRTLATAGDDETLRLWDVSDPAAPRQLGEPLNGDNGTIYLVAFSPDGRTVVTADEDATARLWDVSDPAAPTPLGAPLRGHTAPVRSVAFSPDGQLLAVGGDDTTVQVWNVADRTRPRPVGEPLSGHDATVHSVAFSPDGRTLASGSSDKTVQLWDVSDPERPEQLGQRLLGHTADVWSVAFSPDGRLLASGAADSTARLWNVSDPAHPDTVGQPLTGGTSTVFTVGFSPDGRTLSTGSEDGSARLWSIPESVLGGHRPGPSTPAMSADGRLVASPASGDDVYLWDVADPAHPAPLPGPLTGHRSRVSLPVFRPDGEVVFTGAGDKTVRAWDVRDPARPRQLGDPLVLDTRYSAPLALSPDGNVLATGADDHSVRLWDVRDPAAPRQLGGPLPVHTGYVNSVTFSPDGRLLATASSDRTVALWDVRDPAAPTLLGTPVKAHANPVMQAVFSPDGRVLATASEDRAAKLWDVSDPARPAQLGQPLTGHTESVMSVAFSPDGRELATSSVDRTVRRWSVSDPANARPLGQPLTGHTGRVNRVTYSPDGRYLVTGDGTSVRLWDLDVRHAVDRICATTRGVLTPELWAQHLPQQPRTPPCP